jgi:hypothetical protein
MLRTDRPGIDRVKIYARDRSDAEKRVRECYGAKVRGFAWRAA